MKSLTLTEIKNAFIPADQEQWTDPCVADVPWSDLDFLFWNHVNPGYFYMVVPDGEELIGMIVKMNKDGGNRSGSCDFCFATNRSVGVRPAFIETYDNPRVQVGAHLCGDLRCSLRVRALEEAVFLYEVTTVGKRIERLQGKISRFSQRVASHAKANPL